MRVHERVVVVGGANVDIKGRIAGNHQGQTSHPGMIWRSAGGVGRNIAANLATLQCSPNLIAPVGEDEDGDILVSELEETGVNVSYVMRVRAHATGRYIAVFDSTGELEVAVSDMSIMDRLGPEDVQLRHAAFHDAKVVCIDANVMPATISATLEIANALRIPSVVQTVSVEKSLRVVPFLEQIHTVTTNRDELGAMTGMSVESIAEVERATVALRSLGVKRVVTTLGAEGVMTAHEAGTDHYPTEYVPVIDVTGAGDAFTAGLICGYCRNMTLSNIIWLGQSLARKILTSTESVLKGSLI